MHSWLRDAAFELIICERLIDEVHGVLTERPDPAPGPALTRDPDDDYVIDLARAHDADFIVSGDADLLEWPEQRPPVLTPADFEARWNQP